MSSTDQVTMGLMVRALDAASLRHQTIAGNLANANSVGYRPLRVNFEEQLGFARQALGQSTGRLSAADLNGVRAFIEQEPAPVAGKAAVMIDQEMVRLAQNTLQYQALLRGLNHRISMLVTAVNEGRR